MIFILCYYQCSKIAQPFKFEILCIVFSEKILVIFGDLIFVEKKESLISFLQRISNVMKVGRGNELLYKLHCKQCLNFDSLLTK